MSELQEARATDDTYLPPPIFIIENKMTECFVWMHLMYLISGVVGSIEQVPDLSGHPLCSDAHVEGLVVGVGVGQGGPGLDAPALHEGQQLVGDLGQHILCQSCHAQHLVS